MLGDQVWLTVIVQVSTSQRCWMGLRSGLLTGQLYCCSPDGKIISSWDFLDFVHRCIVMFKQEREMSCLCEALEVINITPAV